MGRRKESNMFNLVNQQTPKVNKRKGKEQTALKSIRKNTINITKISK
jgi:hypothetical protein